LSQSIERLPPVTALVPAVAVFAAKREKEERESASNRIEHLRTFMLPKLPPPVPMIPLEIPLTLRLEFNNLVRLQGQIHKEARASDMLYTASKTTALRLITPFI
jgi:hypothetical protein